MNRYISENTVKNYAYLIESAPKEIAIYAMKWLIESKVTLEFIEKYEVQKIVEERFRITNKMARKLIKKINTMEEAWQNGEAYYSVTYGSCKSPPAKRARRSDSVERSPNGSVLSASSTLSESSFKSLMEEWSGPKRNLNEQMLAGAYYD